MSVFEFCGRCGHSRNVHTETIIGPCIGSGDAGLCDCTEWTARPKTNAPHGHGPDNEMRHHGHWYHEGDGHDHRRRG